MDEINLNIMISSIDRKKNKKSPVSSVNSNQKLQITNNSSNKDESNSASELITRVRSGKIILESDAKNFEKMTKKVVQKA